MKHKRCVTRSVTWAVFVLLAAACELNREYVGICSEACGQKGISRVSNTECECEPTPDKCEEKK